MTPDTLSEMTLGFVVIIGIILIYCLSLILRMAKAKKHFSKYK